jgi:hypothetical protein
MLHPTQFGDLRPDNPFFEKATKKCGKETGIEGFGEGQTYPGMVEFDGSTS